MTLRDEYTREYNALLPAFETMASDWLDKHPGQTDLSALIDALVGLLSARIAHLNAAVDEALSWDALPDQVAAWLEARDDRLVSLALELLGELAERVATWAQAYIERRRAGERPVRETIGQLLARDPDRLAARIAALPDPDGLRARRLQRILSRVQRTAPPAPTPAPTPAAPAPTIAIGGPPAPALGLALPLGS